MKLLRRLIAWSCFLGFLTAVGVGVFWWVRYVPRVVTAGRLTVDHLSADGRWLVTSLRGPKYNYWDDPEKPERDQNNEGYLQVWDVHRQRLERTLDVGFPVVMSPDGRLCLSCKEEGKLLLTEWQAGTTSEVAWDKVGRRPNYYFSPCGRWLHGPVEHSERDWPIFDVRKSQPRPPDTRTFLIFLEDERFAVCAGDARHIEIVELDTGQVQARLTSSFDLSAAPCIATVSPDGELLVVGHAGPAHSWNPSETTDTACFVFRSAEVWDWKRQRLRLRFDEAPDQNLKLIFGDDSRRVAVLWAMDGKYRLTAYDTQSLQLLMTHSIVKDSLRLDDKLSFEYTTGAMSPDGNLVVISRLNGKTNKATMFDVWSGAILWERPYYLGAFSKDGTCVGCRSYESKEHLDILDPQSGQRLRTYTFDLGWSSISDNESFHYQSVCVFHKWHERKREALIWERWLQKVWPDHFGDPRASITVASPSTGREHFACYGNYIDPRWSANGETLIASLGTEWDAQDLLIGRRIYVWSIHPHRAYFWAITWSLGAGILLLLLRRWRVRRKARLQPKASG